MRRRSSAVLLLRMGPTIISSLPTTMRAPVVLASAEAGALDGLAEVVAAHFNLDAHFGEARAHAVADAIAERLLARCAFYAAERSTTSSEVEVVSGDDG